MGHVLKISLCSLYIDGGGNLSEIIMSISLEWNLSPAKQYVIMFLLLTCVYVTITGSNVFLFNQINEVPHIPAMTLARTSGLSLAIWFRKSSSSISSHYGLHSKVYEEICSTIMARVDQGILRFFLHVSRLSS